MKKKISLNPELTFGYRTLIDGKNQNRAQISPTPKESSNNLVKNTNSVQEQEKQEQEKQEQEKKE